jgi:hypothetical protein
MSPPLGAAPAAAPEPRREGEGADAERVEGRDFTVPLPSGFLSITDPRTPPALRDKVEPVITAGGVVLVAEKTEAGWFRGSIVVAPAEGEMPSNAATCRDHASELAAATETTVRKADMATPQSCRWVVQDKKRANRMAVGAVMASTNGHWVVTCNLDARDDAARAACVAVLEGWRAAR